MILKRNRFEQVKNRNNQKTVKSVRLIGMGHGIYGGKDFGSFFGKRPP